MITLLWLQAPCVVGRGLYVSMILKAMATGNPCGCHLVMTEGVCVSMILQAMATGYPCGCHLVMTEGLCVSMILQAVATGYPCGCHLVMTEGVCVSMILQPMAYWKSLWLSPCYDRGLVCLLVVFTIKLCHLELCCKFEKGEDCFFYF